MFEVKLYTANDLGQWNAFVMNSKNGTFLFNRGYMDYHADRFQDFSLLIYRKNKLHALLPANRKNDVLYSHQGLTYGGFITNSQLILGDMAEMFIHTNKFLKEDGISKVVYKTMPHIYHQIPAQEDLYILFKNLDATLIGRNISSTIYQNNKIKFIESRKSGIRKAKNHNILINESDDYAAFWQILEENLQNKHGVAPVHSLQEIELLASRFPEHIKLYLAFTEGRPVGGTVLYLNKQVAHTQYISASLKGKELGALDLLFDFLINEKYIDTPIFDFGQSTEQMGKVLNDALIFQKEGFGGRGIMYDIYEYNIL